MAFNCAALSPGLIESELFGHEKGAFTGADRRKTGKFEIADGGTIFLDEIGDLSLEAQAKVLRVIQERRFERVGGNKSITVDVRVIVATNQNLKEKIAKNEFREDLFYRINVFPLHLPPLREREDDVLLLSDFFAGEYAERLGKPEPNISEDAKKILLQQKWAGNVRELENTIERAMILSSNGFIDKDQLSFLASGFGKEVSSKAPIELPHEGMDLESIEKDLVIKAMEITGNNQLAAAKLLGLTRSKLRSRLKNINKLKKS